MGASGFSISNLIGAAKQDAINWGEGGLMTLGVVLIILGGWFLFKVFTSQQGRGKWIGLMICAWAAAGVLFSWKSIVNVQQGVTTSVTDAGNGKSDSVVDSSKAPK